MAHKDIMQGRSTKGEKTIEATLVSLVEGNYGMCIKLAPMFFAGLPDRLVLLPGKIIFFVETKSKGDKARKLQQRVHGWIKKLGFEVFVPDSVEDVKQIVTQKLSQ